MSAVLEFEDRSIRHVYLFTIGLTVAVVVEALIKGESSTLPIFLIGSTIGFSLFWSIEFAVRRFIFIGKTKYLRSIIFLSRYAISGGLLYFLFASIDIIFAIISCITYFGSTWMGSKLGNAKRITDADMFNLTSYGLKIVLAICIGYFVGTWIGGKLGNAEIGSNIGLAFGITIGLIEVFRLEKQRRDATQKAQDAKEENLLRINNDSSLF